MKAHDREKEKELRDYFAAAALQGIVSDHQTLAETKRSLEKGDSVASVVARAAYVFADAMLEARKEPIE